MALRYVVPAIKRGFDIIERLANRDAGLSISVLHRVLRLPLSSVATIIYTLQELGYLEREQQTSRYYVTVKMFGIARQAVDRMGLINQCHSLLEELVRESDLTGHLAVRRNNESMYIDRIASDGLVQISSYVGLRWPLHTSAASGTPGNATKVSGVSGAWQRQCSALSTISWRPSALQARHSRQAKIEFLLWVHR